MGRRRRSIDNEAETGGEVIEATTLVKKIRIQSPDLGIIPLPSEDVIEDKNLVDEKSTTSSTDEIVRKEFKRNGLNRTSFGRRTKSTTSGSRGVIETGNENSNIMYKLDNQGYYCFGPNSLTIISGVIIFIQALLFTLALIITSRGGIKKLSSRGGDEDHSINSSSSSHQYLSQSPHHLLSNSPTKYNFDGRSSSSNGRRTSSVESRMNYVY